MNKEKYTAEELIEGIKNRNHEVLNFIYENHYSIIKNYITMNCGDEEDARDIFQEAIIIIYKKVSQNVLVLNCSFQSYLFSVCRLLWLKQLRQRRTNIEEKIGDEKPVELSEDIQKISEENDRYELYRYHFERLSKDCQQILSMFLEKISLKEVAESFGFKTEKYAKKRKYQCKEILISNIQQDKKYRQLKTM